MKFSSVKIKQVDGQQNRVNALKDSSVDAAILEDSLMSNDIGNVLIISNKYARKNVSSTQILVDTLNKEIKLLNKTDSYGMAGTALNKMNYDQEGAKVLTKLDLTFKKVHKIKKSDFNKAFKYAKSHKLYKGKVSYRAHTLKVKNVK